MVRSSSCVLIGFNAARCRKACTARLCRCVALLRTQSNIRHALIKPLAAASGRLASSLALQAVVIIVLRSDREERGAAAIGLAAHLVAASATQS